MSPPTNTKKTAAELRAELQEEQKAAEERQRRDAALLKEMMEEAARLEREEKEEETRKREREALAAAMKREREAQAARERGASQQQKKGHTQGAERRKAQDVVFVNPRTGVCVAILCGIEPTTDGQAGRSAGNFDDGDRSMDGMAIKDSKWSTLEGADRCDACKGRDVTCQVDFKTITEWRKAVEEGELITRAPNGTACRNCHSKKHSCFLPATRDPQ